MGTEDEGNKGVFWALLETVVGSRVAAIVRTIFGVVTENLNYENMDTLNTLLIGWIIFTLFVIFLGTFFYDQVIRGPIFRNTVKHENQTKSVDSDAGVSISDSGGNISDGGDILLDKTPAAVPTIVPQEFPEAVDTPVAAGADPDAVLWVNDVLSWLYNTEKPQGGKSIRDAWANGLNDYTVTSALDTGVLVEILEVLPQTPAPQLTNVVVDCPPGTDDMTITCDCMLVVYFRILSTRTAGPMTTESEYACAVERLAGRLHIDVYTTEQQAIIKFVGWPQVTLALEGIRNNSTGLDELTLQDVISELLTAALRNLVLTLHFTQIPNFPPFTRSRQVPDKIVPIGYDSMAAAQQQSSALGSNGTAAGIPGLNGKRLLVKIVKAASVGCDQDVSEAYAVVEMDEPGQKFTTTVVRDTNSPFWDEQFLFDLSEGTLELLFELYDKSTNQFLGLAIVGIEELVATPSQRQIIPLQPRPYEDDQVSGTLTLEFLFLDRADIPELTLRSSDTKQRMSPRGDLVTTTTTTYIKSSDTQDVMVNGCSDSLASSALRDIEERNIPVSNNANKSTMIIHASRKMEKRQRRQPEEEQVAVDTDGSSWQDSQSPASKVTSETEPPATDITSPPQNDDAQPDQERGRSRGRSGKRDSFFGTLKKRFSRSRLRSKSMDPTAVTPGSTDSSVPHTNGHQTPENVPRSISMERQTHRASGGDGGSTRSSLSDHSAISSSSTRTYVNENSTLIVEAVENGVTKHYLIPLSLQQRSKWRKKGTKLHVFNEHIFIAKHISSGTPCQVCQKTLGRRLGKQGYECRDCGFKSHKPCHVKTDTVCPNSTVNSMDLMDAMAVLLQEMSSEHIVYDSAHMSIHQNLHDRLHANINESMHSLHASLMHPVTFPPCPHTGSQTLTTCNTTDASNLEIFTQVFTDGDNSPIFTGRGRHINEQLTMASGPGQIIQQPLPMVTSGVMRSKRRLPKVKGDPPYSYPNLPTITEHDLNQAIKYFVASHDGYLTQPRAPKSLSNSYDDFTRISNKYILTGRTSLRRTKSDRITSQEKSNSLGKFAEKSFSKSVNIRKSVSSSIGKLRKPKFNFYRPKNTLGMCVSHNSNDMLAHISESSSACIDRSSDSNQVLLPKISIENYDCRQENIR